MTGETIASGVSIVLGGFGADKQVTASPHAHSLKRGDASRAAGSGNNGPAKDERRARPRLRILFLQKRILFPPDNGGKIRTLNILRYLAQWHDVTYVCNRQPGEETYAREMQNLGLRLEMVPWRETSRESMAFYKDLALNVFSRFPYNVAKDTDRRLRNRAAQLLRSEPFDLVICDFVQMARNAIGLSGPPKLLFQHNVEAEIFKRHSQNDDGRLRRFYMALQHKKMRRFESRAGRHFQAVVAVSSRDRRIFESDYHWRHVYEIETAVDVEYFQPGGAKECPDHLIFVGSMDWLPNVDGVQRFIRDVWPRIRAARPEATFRIVGRRPKAAVRRLAEIAGVEVVGTVPDVRPYFDSASVVVVPLSVGGGTRIKIFEAMAMGKPVVSTSVGAEGLAAEPGKHFELADTSEEFAEMVIRLLSNRKYRARLGADAREHVCKHFSAEVVAREFDRICRETVARNRRSGFPVADRIT